MGMRTTAEIIEEYLSTLPESKLDSDRPCFDTKKIEAYENMIGKNFLDMTAEEVIGMIASFDRGKAIPKSAATAEAYASRYRNFFDWAARNVKLMLNPMNDPCVTPQWIAKKITEAFGAYTPGYIDKIVNAINNNIPSKMYAEYMELLVLLYYNGLTSENIINLKESDVDKSGSGYAVIDDAKFGRMQIRLSERCIKLLEYFNTVRVMDSMTTHRELFLSWRGGYFRFIVRCDDESRDIQAEFDARPYERIRQKMANLVSTRIPDKIGIPVGIGRLQKAGFRDFLDKKVGREHANQLLLSKHDKKLDKELSELAREFGDMTTPSNIRKKMKQYVY